MPHLHITGLEAAKIVLIVLIAGALVRIVEMHTKETTIGKALAFIY